DIFARYGVAKTTIRELSKAAGISSVRFYMFFYSKEDLYYEIFTGEIRKFNEEYGKMMEKRDVNPAELVGTFIRNGISMIENNQLFRTFVWEAQTHVFQKFASRTNEMKDFLIRVVKIWNDMGILIPEKPEVIAGTIRAIFFSAYHKGGIGEANYDKSMKLLIDSVARGIIKG
ncbi:MAG: TetR/AcrR family transcriptional regulator, partial [Brevinematales bacterium]